MSILGHIRRKRVVVSLEGEIVRVLYVVRDARKTVVEKALTFRDDEFEGFLATCNEQEFIVVTTFSVFYQDILSLPPAKDKYFPAVVEAGIAKNFTGAGGFLFFHNVLEEAQQEGRKTKETFVFAVDYEQVAGIIERFERHGKTVAGLYPSVLAVAALLKNIREIEGETVLAVLDTAGGKTLFLLQQGRIRFVRFVTSDEHGFQAADIDNINMTIGYFRQTFKISPEHIVFFSSDTPGEEATRLVVPQVTIKELPDVSLEGAPIDENAIPVSAAVASYAMKDTDLRPPAFRTLPVKKRMLNVAVIVLSLTILGGLGSIAFSFHSASILKTKIAGLEREISEKEPIFKSSEAANNSLQKIRPLVAYLNKSYSSPSLARLIADLSFLPMDRVVPDSIDLASTEGAISVRIKGSIRASTFADMDSRYKELVRKLRAVKGLQLTTDQVDPKDMSFTVEAKWKT